MKDNNIIPVWDLGTFLDHLDDPHILEFNDVDWAVAFAGQADDPHWSANPTSMCEALGVYDAEDCLRAMSDIPDDKIVGYNIYKLLEFYKESVAKGLDKEISIKL